MKCKYCGDEVINGPIFVIRKAIKPPYHPYRWQNKGYCCEHCYKCLGKTLSIEYVKGDPDNEY